MKIEYGFGKTVYGPGVSISLSGDEVAEAILNYVEEHGVYIGGARTVTVNDELCESGHIYVDPSGSVKHNDKFYSGKGNKTGSIYDSFPLVKTR